MSNMSIKLNLKKSLTSGQKCLSLQYRPLSGKEKAMNNTIARVNRHAMEFDDGTPRVNAYDIINGLSHSIVEIAGLLSENERIDAYDEIARMFQAYEISRNI